MNKKVNVVRKPRGIDYDLIAVPNWLANSDEIGPCPCGEPPDPTCLLIQGSGDPPLGRWLHHRCLDFLEHDMDKEEIEEKREWEQRMRRLQKEDNDD